MIIHFLDIPLASFIYSQRILREELPKIGPPVSFIISSTTSPLNSCTFRIWILIIPLIPRTVTSLLLFLG
jgi:hypothetical protein